MLFNKENLPYSLAFLVSLLAFIAIKYSHLNVSFFWDESWVYAPAIQHMADAGPSILPGKVDLYLTRGHPLFFHFLGGVWLSIFGKSFVAAHSFALCISLLFAVSLFYMILKVWDAKIALYTSAIFLFQLVFIAQSSMVLPEVLVAALSILTIYAFIMRQWSWYVLWGCLLLLTKETGIIGILACNSYAALSLIFGRSKWKELIYSCIPYLSFLLFLIVQKIEYGWFLYPDHVSMMEFNPEVIFEKIKSIFTFLFIGQGRAIFFAIAIVLSLLSYDHIKYSQLNRIQKRFLICFGIFIIGYIVFSALNFLTLRYLLVLLPLFILGAVILISCSTEGLKKLDHVVLGIAILFFAIQHEQRSPVLDINLSYLDYCPLHQELVQYLEKEIIYDQYIYTDFLNETALKEPYAGYRTNNQKFTRVNQWDKQPTEKIIVINSIESAHKKIKLKEDKKATLLKRFENGDVWFEIYKRVQ